MTSAPDKTTDGKAKLFEISSFALHIIAMLLMLCDHMWARLIPGNDWLTCIGRLAFPIFAFMIAEGYTHTSSLKRYVLRLLIFAVISEIPFDLMYSGTFFYPFHQNVMWTFLIAIGLIHLNETARKKKKLCLTIITAIGTAIIGYLLGFVFMTDYYGTGVLTVLAFYFFRGRSAWQYIAQLAAIIIINFVMLEGLQYEFTVLGGTFYFPQQGFAVLALIPIWLYHGRQGYHSKWFRWLCYSFYPVHMLFISVIRMFLI